MARKKPTKRPRRRSLTEPRTHQRGESIPRHLPASGLLFPNTMAGAVQMREIRRLREALSSLSSRGARRGPETPPPKSSRRGKLPEAAFLEHVRLHKLGKRNRDGSLFSVRQRLVALKDQQHITIDRTTLQKRLKKFGEAPPAP